ncbi:MAG TPA: Asp-tRNA(Asn)/Glu-tRNA(Gln) amidotransferase subunit GatB [Saprospiraceae bacterium]|nr:Asp-tRNA(Asn)/Glu-tRNA(Gln) amidotransferase subunit GatB [Saprospiraceae bacterium]
MSYETVIGLEIHVQLATRSKLFCADSTAFGAAPNTQVSAISLAHPGTLPRLNRRAVDFAVQLGLALDCEISRHSAFDRKNYFYADLPKGYQITQDLHPICRRGAIRWMTEQGAFRQCAIHHIHLEEDAGKSIHDQSPAETLIDLNRAGVPLLEIVTEPELRSAADASACLEAIRRLVRWLGVSDGNMEEGSLRCDVNVSVRPTGSTQLGTRCEVKNVNSFRFVRRAIEHEAARQIELLQNGGRIEQETRGFDAATGATYSLREKEQAHDYRYFPEPDLPPVILQETDIEHIKAQLPRLPQAVEQQLLDVFALPPADVAVLSADQETAFYFLKLAEGLPGTPMRALANFTIQRMKPWAESNGRPLAEYPLDSAAIGAYLDLIESGKLSASAAAQRLLPALLEQPGTPPEQLANSLDLLQNADTGFLDQLADEVLARFPDKVEEYRKGKKGLIGFFMGELMKASKGKAEPGAANKILSEKLR